MAHISQYIDETHVHRIYNSYIFPHLKYGVEMYGTAKAKYLKKLQTIQNKLLKILSKRDFRDSSRGLLKEKNIMNCKSIHMHFISLFVYKQQNNMLPNIFTNYFEHCHNIHDHNTRQVDSLSLNLFRTDSGQNTIMYKGAKYWNELPLVIRNANTLYIFKRLCKSNFLSI